MDYQGKLNDGQVINMAGAEINVTELTTSLNDQRLSFVNFGGAIENKHLIMSIVPTKNIQRKQKLSLIFYAFYS
ncbi:hypothetical protein [Lysinibacillus sphaericus]|uniref:Uncharacterized protein n=1 Tax=Lysinibacillus sphaericus OT4b.31 TaxID=1285586 RepID=R7Z932_LYSSH|nr:hypothetical protein [Lysinibacillus sphaericus]EON70675.1 hypothetical protein H131_20627 [Lysinibacillus sphaericus OT4b.31]